MVPLEAVVSTEAVVVVGSIQVSLQLTLCYL